jgi:hypothetical protein
MKMSTQQASSEHVIFRTLLIVAMILFAAMVRIVPHPWNLTPIGAMALFSGAVIRNRWLAFVFPMLALVAGDFYIGFHVLMPIVYVSFLVSVAIGLWLRENRTIVRLGGAVLLGAVQFFVITNLGVWMFLNSYPKNFGGLVSCYTAALPFFGNTLAGDVFFSAVLFGALFLAERKFPVLRTTACEIR